VAVAALAVVPIVLILLRDYPADVGTIAYGATSEEVTVVGPVTGSSAARAVRALRDAARTRTFWLLAGGFAICGMSTNGLVGTHFVTAAHDHGMPPTTAASLLALVGLFDIAGTIFSGWLTDRVDPRLLLAVYYTLRGVSLVILPSLFGPNTEPPMWAFIVFYGLDWIATVPPTVALCRGRFGTSGPVVFGWVFASHQIGAALAAVGAGAIRDTQGTYDPAWFMAGGLCVVAASLSLAIRPIRDPALAETRS
jgi:predicted MFS family arabinose efflux permease